MNENEKIIQLMPYAYGPLTALALTNKGRMFGLLLLEWNKWKEIELPNFN